MLEVYEPVQGEVVAFGLSLENNESMVYSQQTYELDAQTTVSALRDVIQKQLNAGHLQLQMDRSARRTAKPWIPLRHGSCCARRYRRTRPIR